MPDRFIQIRIQADESKGRKILRQCVREMSFTYDRLLRIRQSGKHLFHTGVLKIFGGHAGGRGYFFLFFNVFLRKSLKGIEQVQRTVRKKAVDLRGEYALVDSQLGRGAGQVSVPDLLCKKAKTGKAQIQTLPQRHQALDEAMVAKTAELPLDGQRSLPVDDSDPHQIRLKRQKI